MTLDKLALMIVIIPQFNDNYYVQYSTLITTYCNLYSSVVIVVRFIKRSVHNESIFNFNLHVVRVSMMTLFSVLDCFFEKIAYFVPKFGPVFLGPGFISLQISESLVCLHYS